MSMAFSESAIGLTGGMLFVGLSATVQLPALATQLSLRMEYINGSTIWIAGHSAAVFGQGAIWGVTAQPTYILPDYRGSLYFTAGGATATIAWTKELSAQT